MLDRNRQWLEQANPGLLSQYKKQKRREPQDYGNLRCLTMSHEPNDGERRDGYISPIYYHKQAELTKGISANIETKDVRFCVIGGTDGGYLLNHVVRNRTIKHLVVIETNLNSFYHSLQETDWPALFKSFEDRGGTIYFHIGQVTSEIKRRLAIHLNEVGPFNAANIHMIYDGTEAGKINIAQTIQCLQDCINSLGFYDDERVGMAQTLFKMKKGAKFLRSYASPYIQKPAVICGNGPSLNKIIPQIKENRDNMIVFACGSAFGALVRNGIKPDFYIEQERPKITSDFTLASTTPDDRKGVTAIGLNVVHPQTDSLFDECVYVLKANDFGAFMARQYINAPQIMFVNPLVSNAGSSIAVALGFKHIYLAGVDCGLADDGSVHAMNYGDEDKVASTTVPGNFRAEVKTTSLYIDSKRSLESLIELCPAVNFYNLSDGALINGAKPTKKFRAKKCQEISKDKILENFKPCEIAPNEDEIRRRFTASMFGLKGVIDSIPEKIKSSSEAWFYIDAVHDYMTELKKKDNLFWYMIKGTLTTQLVFLSFCADSDLEVFDKSSALLKEFIGLAHGEMKTRLFEFNTWDGDFGKI